MHRRQALSYAAGPSETSLIYQTIGAAFDEAVARDPLHAALVMCHQNLRLSYGELAEQVDRFAIGLDGLGLQKGDRIGIWAPNCAEWIITQIATAKLGLILVNINPAYRLSELEYALTKVGCRALVLAERFKTSDYTGMVLKLQAGEDGAKPVSTLEHLIVIADDCYDGFLRFVDLVLEPSADQRSRLREISASLQPEDPINIQFTSGTTGFPKGATLTHHNILNNGYFCGARMGLGPGDKLCIPVPLYHCFGMVLGVLTCITHSATMVFPSEAFDPTTVLKAVSEERCTALHGVPTMFIAELDHPDFNSFDLSALRTGVMAGSPCPVEVMKKVIARMNMAQVTIGYGMTEVSPLSFQSLPTDDLQKRVSTVGSAHPFVESKIVDQDGRVLPRGEQGEILFRGYSVMQGYWNDDERTAEAIDEAGWMHSGDLATMDEAGYVTITGRVKDMIIRGGENIYPREIEEFLYHHPAIQEVQVFGVPDSKYGEEVCAWIQRKDDLLSAEDVRSFCQGQIAHYKIPRHIRFVSAYPTTVTGKIQKFEMRREMARMLEALESST